MTVNDPYGEIARGPKGWATLVEDLVADLNKFGAEIEVVQVKEKFGGLRFYVDLRGQVADSEWKEIYDRIDQAESQSFEICQNCGNSGETKSNSHGWILTLCDGCRGKREKEGR